MVNIEEEFSKFEKNIFFERMLLENLKMKTEFLNRNLNLAQCFVMQYTFLLMLKADLYYTC